MTNNKELEGCLRENDFDIGDKEADALVAELAADGIVVSREEARLSVHRLAELLLLISEPLPLPTGPANQEAEDPSPERGEPAHWRV